MDKKQMKEIENLQKLKESGALTEEEFKNEKNKILSPAEKKNEKIKDGFQKKKINKTLIIVEIIALLIIIAIVVFFIGKTKSTNNLEINSTESSVKKIKDKEKGELSSVNKDNISFSNYDPDDPNFDDTQKNIIKYFNIKNYIWFYSLEAQKYPQIFKEKKIWTNASVIKVINSTDEEYEVIASNSFDELGEVNSYKSLDEVPAGCILDIKGKQLNERLTPGELVDVYGTCESIENKEIDGKTYMVSNINVDFTRAAHHNTQKGSIEQDPLFSYDMIKNIAEYIFGKDIKVSKESDGGQVNYYNIVLDDQSNANFQSFYMTDNEPRIIYGYNGVNASEKVYKNLYVSADFQHFIVTTYDDNTKHVYVEYFDKDHNKMWSREFNYKSSKNYASPIDSNNDTLAIVIDDYLYIIDLKTGKDKVEPLLVGGKIRVSMMDDGIILIGDDTKDTIMKVDYSGKIVFKNDVSFEGQIDDDGVTGSQVQFSDDKIFVVLSANESFDYGDQFGVASIYKLVLLNKNGEIESISNDLVPSANAN